MTSYEIKQALEERVLRPLGAWRARRIDEHLPLSSDRCHFVILSAPRSGSNLFCHLLSEVPGILCFHELFHRKKVYVGKEHMDDYDFGPTRARDSDLIGFLGRVFNANDKKRAIGFKIFPGHNETALHYCLLRLEIKKILLFRDNALKVYSSHLIAQQTDHWASDQDNRVAGRQRKVHINARKLERYTAFNERFFEHARNVLGQTGQQFLSLRFEDVLSPDFAAIREAASAVECPVDDSVELKMPIRRQNSPLLSERIANYAELREELANTRFAKFFTE